METQDEKELIEFIILNLKDADYDMSYANGSEIISIDINDDKTGAYFRVNAIDEKSVRAHYKLHDDRPDQTIVVELSECRDKACLMCIKKCHLTIRIGK